MRSKYWRGGGGGEKEGGKVGERERQMMGQIELFLSETSRSINSTSNKLTA